MKRACRILLPLLPMLALSSGRADEPAAAVPAQSVPPIAAAAQIKTIGVIGGISWVSSAEYYRQLNQGIAARLGGLHSAPVLMYSIAFGPFAEQERLALDGDWAPLRATMLDSARRLERGGADVIIIASNTSTRLAPTALPTRPGNASSRSSNGSCARRGPRA